MAKTIPQLRSVIGFFVVIELITMLSWVFAYVYSMTGGGPGFASSVVELYIWKNAFAYRAAGYGPGQNGVDPKVLGGLVARVGDTVIDGTVRHRLEQLKEQI